MSEAYIPDCNKCKNKKGCCNSDCIQRLSERKLRERHKYDGLKQYLKNKTVSSPEEAEEIRECLKFIDEYEKR